MGKLAGIIEIMPGVRMIIVETHLELADLLAQAICSSRVETRAEETPRHIVK